MAGEFNFFNSCIQQLLYNVPAGRKRAAEESATEKRETRSAKVPRTEARKSAKGTGKKGAARLKVCAPASLSP